jgi:glycerol kinase
VHVSSTAANRLKASAAAAVLCLVMLPPGSAGQAEGARLQAKTGLPVGDLFFVVEAAPADVEAVPVGDDGTEAGDADRAESLPETGPAEPEGATAAEPESASNTGEEIIPPGARLHRLTASIAAEYDLDSRMLAAVITVESSWVTDAEGAHGEIGLMQILPETARWLAGLLRWTSYDLRDPDQNIRMGAYYLRVLLDEYGSWEQALAAYNGGPRAAPSGADNPYTRRVLRAYASTEGLQGGPSKGFGEVNDVKFVLALDQGTTSSRAILFDTDGRTVAIAQKEFTQHYPHPGWVEHDAEEIWATQLGTAHEALAKAGITGDAVSAIGITNQRETTVLWDRQTGRPVAPAIVWQCRRTADYCRQLKEAGWEAPVRSKTGLVIDAYFSGTKVKWILDQVHGLRQRAADGEVLFGTIDTWLLWKLSGGRIHATDYSNASRTLLYNIYRLDWDDEILAEMSIPRAMLPRVLPSSGTFGLTDRALFGAEIPLAGVAGDQQAALFGQACFQSGMAKNTYGTGCFLLMNTGSRPVESKSGLLTTIAWGMNGEVEYALEGSVFIAGAAVQWLRDELRIVDRASDSEPLARSVDDTGGVYLVPAFVGLGAPHWDSYARGLLVGLTRGTGRAQIARAALESIAYQTRDVLDAMSADAGLTLKALRVDGGAAANDFLLQFQADILATPVERPRNLETTAMGAAYLAGLATGVWDSKDAVTARWQVARRFEPSMAEEGRVRLYQGWQEAVKRSLGWAAT